MLAEVAALCRRIPHRGLCIQWEIFNAMCIWDGQPSEAVPGNLSHEAIIERVLQLCAALPEHIEPGLHHCYGNFGARHFECRQSTCVTLDARLREARLSWREIAAS